MRKCYSPPPLFELFKADLRIRFVTMLVPARSPNYESVAVAQEAAEADYDARHKVIRFLFLRRVTFDGRHLNNPPGFLNSTAGNTAKAGFGATSSSPR